MNESEQCDARGNEARCIDVSSATTIDNDRQLILSFIVGEYAGGWHPLRTVSFKPIERWYTSRNHRYFILYPSCGEPSTRHVL